MLVFRIYIDLAKLREILSMEFHYKVLFLSPDALLSAELILMHDRHINPHERRRPGSRDFHEKEMTPE